jgi:peptidoglycan/LPS O-acetylase OafA/YrhL
VRNPTLDILRAVAILLVFARHSEGAPIISHLGWIGVDLFFVLSGFLVSGLLFREYQQSGQVAPGRFLLRRGFKIYPQFYLLVAVTLIVTAVAGSSINLREAIAEIVFVQNYAPGLWAHTWSLAVEEHFYLLLTIWIVFLARRGGEDPFRSLPGWIVTACVAILSFRIATWLAFPATSDYVHIFPSHLRMDSLLTGVLLSYYYVFQQARVQRFMQRFCKWLPQISIVFLAPAAFLDQSDPWMYTLGFSSISIGFALLLLSAVHPRKAAKSAPGIFAKCMARLGQVSYGFYLWHGPVLFADDRLLARWIAHGINIPISVNLIATFLVTVAIAFATTWLAEQPFLRLRDRWFPSRVVPLNQELVTLVREAA